MHKLYQPTSGSITVNGQPWQTLDEPTSVMAAHTEAFVLKLLHRLKGEMTIFMVTHRMHSLAGVDHVYPLQNGYLSSLPAPKPGAARRGAGSIGPARTRHAPRTQHTGCVRGAWR